MKLAFRPRLRRVLARTLATLNASRHRRAGLTFVKPCYWIADRLKADDKILDIGLGIDADFSVAMISRFAVRSVGIDPTSRHQQGLAAVALRTNGRLEIRQVAVGGASGRLTFHESLDNVSGSILDVHPNVTRDRIKSYEVDVLTLEQAVGLFDAGGPKLVKMDIEGAEYDVLEQAGDSTLSAADQWVIEFHHDLIPGIAYCRTAKCVRRFTSLGYTAFTRDGVNFLFYRTR